MAAVGTAFVNVKADLDGFDRDIDHAGRGWVSSFTSIGKTAAKGFAIGAAAVGVGAAIFGRQAITAASDYAETLSKSTTIFGDQAEAITAWSRTASRSFGQSQTAALDAAGSFGNMFVQLGIGQEQAAGMSTSMTELASDFASFHNADISEVLLAQQAAFRGEYDAVQRFVPTINAAAVELKAMEMGLADSTKELTAQDKALATNALLLEGAGDAAGDFDRTSGGLANQQRTLGAAFADIKVQVGQFLLPIMTRFVGFLNTGVIPLVRNVIAVFGEQGLAGVFRLLGDRITEAWPGIQSGLGTLLSNIGSWISDTALPWLGEHLQLWAAAFVAWVEPLIPPLLDKLGALLARLGNWIIDTALPQAVAKLTELGQAFVDWIEPQIPGLIEKLGLLLAAIAGWIAFKALPALVIELEKLQRAFIGWVIQVIPEVMAGLGRLGAALAGWIGEQALKLGAAWDGIKALVSGGVDAVIGFIEAIPGRIASFASSMWNGIKESFRSAINWIIRGWNSIELPGISFPGWDIPGPGPNIPGFTTPTIGTPDIPLLSDGAILMPRPGGVPFIGAERGHAEAVIPLDRLNRMVDSIQPGGANAALLDAIISTLRRPEITVNTSDERAVDRLKQEMRRQELLAS